jgi:hypothetical protein
MVAATQSPDGSNSAHRSDIGADLFVMVFPVKAKING